MIGVEGVGGLECVGDVVCIYLYLYFVCVCVGGGFRVELGFSFGDQGFCARVWVQVPSSLRLFLTRALDLVGQ